MPPLPPLTRISNLHSNRRTNPPQNGQFKFVSQETRNLQKAESNFLKSTVEDEQIDLNRTNGNLGIQQPNNGITNAIPAPKKNLPHKKRITKKLKHINQPEEQTQLNMQIQQNKTIQQVTQLQQPQQLQSSQTTLQYSNQQQVLNNFQQQMQAHEIQPMHQQQQRHQHSQIIQQTKQDESKSPLYTNQMENLMVVQQYPNPTANSQVKVKPLNVLQSTQNIYSCEICGNQSRNQFEFFAHLKSHYEPKTTLEHQQKHTLNVSYSQFFVFFFFNLKTD